MLVLKLLCFITLDILLKPKGAITQGPSTTATTATTTTTTQTPPATTTTIPTTSNEILCSTTAINNTCTVTLAICPKKCRGQPYKIWGNNIYRDDSNICAAAIHFGAISDAGGTVLVKELPGQVGYDQASRSEIAARRYAGSWPKSFTFILFQQSPTPAASIQTTTTTPATTTQTTTTRLPSVVTQPTTTQTTTSRIPFVVTQPTTTQTTTSRIPFVVTQPTTTQTTTTNTPPITNQTAATTNTAPITNQTAATNTPIITNQTATTNTQTITNQTATTNTAPITNQTATTNTTPSTNNTAIYTTHAATNNTATTNTTPNKNNTATNITHATTTATKQRTTTRIPSLVTESITALTSKEELPLDTNYSLIPNAISTNTHTQTSIAKSATTGIPETSGEGMYFTSKDVQPMTTAEANTGTEVIEKSTRVATTSETSNGFSHKRFNKTIAVCNGTTIAVSGFPQSLTFASTPVGRTAMSVEKCDGVRPVASVDCLYNNQSNTGGYFGKPYVVSCNTSMASILASATSPNATAEDVGRSVASIKLLTNQTNITSILVHNASQVLFQLSKGGPKKAKISVNTLYDVMLTVGQLSNAFASPSNSPGAPSNQTRLQTQRLRTLLQNFADQVVIPPNKTSVFIRTDTITIQVNQTTREPSTSFATVFYAPPSDAGSSGQVSATVPGSILDQASLATKSPSTVRLSFIVQHNSKLYPSNENPPGVMSVSIKGYKPKSLTTPINITFATTNKTQGEVPLTNGTLKSVVTRTQCSVYKPQTATWVPNGCLLVTGSSPPKCSCNTLASFSMIVSDKVFPSAFALGIVSYIGIILSVIGLLLTIVIYLAIKELRIRQPTHYLLNICVNLLISNLIFMFGVGRSESRAGCYITTALLQYFLLVAWFWMSANAYNMYRALTRVAHIGGSSTTLPTLICFLVPVGIIAINCGVAISIDEKLYYPGNIFFESSYHHRSMCWLHASSLYYGFLLPVGILALLNFACFVVVICKLTCLSTKIQSTATGRSKKEDFVIAVAVLIMMGLTWIFGFLMLLSEDIVYLSIMAWLFTVFNSLQGFLIFVLNCLRQEKIRKMWLHPFIDILTCTNRKKAGDGRSVSHMMTDISKRSSS